MNQKSGDQEQFEGKRLQYKNKIYLLIFSLHISLHPFPLLTFQHGTGIQFHVCSTESQGKKQILMGRIQGRLSLHANSIPFGSQVESHLLGEVFHDDIGYIRAFYQSLKTFIIIIIVIIAFATILIIFIYLLVCLLNACLPQQTIHSFHKKYCSICLPLYLQPRTQCLA